MKFSERLKKARKNKGYTQEQLAKIIGVSKQAYRLYEQNGTTPREKVLEKICETLEVDSDYLFNTEILPFYQKLSEPRQSETINFAKEKLIEQEKENNVIPLHRLLVPYEVEEEQALSAGLGEGYTDYSNKELLYWDKEISYDRAIRIKGESMEPDFHYGEVALIKYQECIDYPGQVCAVDDTERGKAYIKCVTSLEEGLLLQSINDLEDEDGNRLFPDIFIPFEDNPRIIGVVKDHFLPIKI